MITNFTEEAFTEYYYSHGRFPDGQYSSQEKKLNEAQLKTKYKKYVKRQEKIKEKFSKKFDVPESILEMDNEQPSTYLQRVLAAEKQVKENDPNYEEWKKNLSREEIEIIEKKMYICKDKDGEVIYDPAHVIPRSKSRTLAKNLLNIIMLPRYVHSLLDSYKDPITEKSIPKEEVELWWKKILGEERYNLLNEEKYKR
jgi:hypothetical protein